MTCAALAFCNDIDFADWETYCETHRVLRESYGIEVEDSFWLFDPGGSEMALFKSDLSEKGPRHDELLEHIRDGRLDILHSAGAFDRLTTRIVPSRGLIAEGLAYLREHARVPAVWTNHGDEGNIQNIGWGGATYHQGDDPSSDCYILDILQQYGVRYYWTDRLYTHDFVSSRDGQGAPAIVRREPTRAGMTIQGFVRYRGALPKAPDAQSLAKQLTEEHMRQLVERGGAVVIYQHWCVHRDIDGRPFTARRPVFPTESQQALKHLADLRDRGLVEVRKTYELLQACQPSSN